MYVSHRGEGVSTCVVHAKMSANGVVLVFLTDLILPNGLNVIKFRYVHVHV